MAKKRIYEVAKELNIDNKTVVDKAKELGFDVKSHMSSLDDNEAKKLTEVFSKKQTSGQSNSSKKTKIKISVGAIRRPKHSDKKKNFSNKKNDSKKTAGQNENRKREKNNRPAARDLLKELQDKQRKDSVELNKQTERSRMQYENKQNKKKNTTREENNKASVPVEGAEAVKARVQASKKVTGPKIVKLSPARNQQKKEKPRVRKVTPTIPSAPIQEQDQKRNNNRKKDFGKPGRKHHEVPEYERERSDHSDKARRRRNKKNKRNNQSQEVKKQPTQRKERPLPETLVYEEGMNAQDLGKILHREPAEIVKKLFMLGVMTNQNQSLDKDTIELLAAEYGIEAEEKVHEDISDIDTLYTKEVEASKNSKNQVKRPPVVTIMGHVDHGKTTLLDRLRHTNVSEHEAGGITQSIGAYQVKLDDRKITFLDTPGHAAFSNMRARGAEITDIVVLVVAADDGVMPQTIEAIDHAKSAGVPIIVAVNKIDKPGANPDHVMEELMQHGLVPEDWGGDTIFVKISAKTGENVEDLLQMILLQADVLELKADPDQKAIGTVVEARLDKGRGPVADLLVQQGTLKVGDPIVIGDTYGRVRVMTNDKGRRIKEAKPSTPVEITGLNDVPSSADKLVVFDDEKTARNVGEQRAKNALEKQRENVQHVTLDNLFDTMKKENMKSVDIVLKADVQGSVEALQQSLEKIDVEGVRVNIIHASVGAINESDVTLAAASNAFIIGFNVRPTATAKAQAESEGVDMRLYNIIYKAMDDVEAAMKGMLEPTYEEKVTGNLTVRETWKVSKVGTIAGAFVDSGYVTRDSGIRVIRDGIVKYDGKVASLKRFKDDVKEVKQGFDCGLTIENFNDIKVDDELEAYEMQEVKPQ
ncbi:translation initiation factor IF-2 [Lactobacillus rodentium]|uniref:Translation initiation factor IF-2 n=2 Tax=Lactobacillus rodentium TaxID=947835 RepID=A0A2Z6TFT3_9LACO|nr:translation initiation factor IF-2 [Lactobacillus rodentium]MCR1894848.1 translation initiation factor IF-2 [Lactobacillus rodentium]GBG05150.1 translation initiation factor IF-2 [Lactobacillus rodentium]